MGAQAKVNEKSQCFKRWETLGLNLINYICLSPNNLSSIHQAFLQNPKSLHL